MSVLKEDHILKGWSPDDGTILGGLEYFRGETSLEEVTQWRSCPWRLCLILSPVVSVPLLSVCHEVNDIGHTLPPP
jgi:hypothetical protein